MIGVYEMESRFLLPVLDAVPENETAAPNVAYRELSRLPSTIRIGPGKLEITCVDAQDLLRQLMEPRRQRRYASVVDRKQEAN